MARLKATRRTTFLLIVQYCAFIVMDGELLDQHLEAKLAEFRAR